MNYSNRKCNTSATPPRGIIIANRPSGDIAPSMSLVLEQPTLIPRAYLWTLARKATNVAELYTSRDSKPPEEEERKVVIGETLAKYDVKRNFSTQ